MAKSKFLLGISVLLSLVFFLVFFPEFQSIPSTVVPRSMTLGTDKALPPHQGMLISKSVDFPRLVLTVFLAESPAVESNLRIMAENISSSNSGMLVSL